MAHPVVVLRTLEHSVALDAEVAYLLAALVRTLRYDDVRGTDVGAIRAVRSRAQQQRC